MLVARPAHPTRRCCCRATTACSQHGQSADGARGGDRRAADAPELSHVLTGCAPARCRRCGRALGDDWRLVSVAPADSMTCTCTARSDAALAAGRGVRRGADSGWRADYGNFQERPAAAHPARSARGRAPFDLQLDLSQVELNAPLGAEVFAFEIPASASPITLDELRHRARSERMAADRSLRVPRVREDQPRPSRARRARRTAITSCGRRSSRSRCTTR